MNLELEFGEALCYTPIFRINGIEANYEDFGDKFDDMPEETEDYSCGNMAFHAESPNQEVLLKYSITTDEYEEIAVKLTSGLSFGCCGLCS